MGAIIQNIRETSIIGPACRERFLPLRRAESAPLRVLTLEHAGLSELRGRYEMSRPRARFGLALYTLKGSAWLRTPVGERILKPGDLLLAPPRSAYAYGLRRTAPWTIAWFHFTAGTPLAEALPPDVSVRRSFLAAPLVNAMDGWLYEALRDDPGAPRAAALHVELIALYLRRELEPPGDPRTRQAKQRLLELWDRVAADLAAPWTVADLAGVLHASPVHLHRLCHAHYGRAPMRQLTFMRMQRAEELLRGTADPLKQIAARVGYANEFAFSAAFKRHAQRSPRAFRSMNKEAL